jgi:hypothetical protein
MAYPQYFYPQQQMQQYQLPQTQLQNQQIQNGGFILVRSEDEARNYPVALGNSVTFKNESAPYIYTKTMGFSQMDRPSFDKYKLIKEEASEALNSSQKGTLDNDLINSTMNDLKREIESIWNEIDMLKKKPTAKKKEVIADDAE